MALHNTTPSTLLNIQKDRSQFVKNSNNGRNVSIHFVMFVEKNKNKGNISIVVINSVCGNCFDIY